MDDVVVTAVETSMGSGLRQFGQVAHLARSLAAAQCVADVVEAGAVAAWEALHASLVSVGRLDAGRGTVTVLRNIGDLNPGQERVPAAESYRLSDCGFLRGLVERGGTWRYVVGQPDRDSVQECTLAVLGAGSVLAVPIVVGGRIWGGLYLRRHRSQLPFDDVDVELGTVLTAVIGAGLAQVERVETLALLARTDPMTGLANRRGADEALETALADHREAGTSVMVVLCDVNGLKRVNDTFGHPAGDLVLTRVSALLSVASAELRGMAARVGGDEFCLVVAGVPLSRVIDTVQALSEAARLLPFGAGVSCGVASAEACAAIGEEVTAKQLFRLADAAQYRAKRTGGVRVGVIGPDDVPEILTDPADLPADTGCGREPGPVRSALGDWVAAAVAALRESGQRAPLARFVVIAETAASWWQAAGWAVSTLDPGADVMVTRATTMSRGGPDSVVAAKLSEVGFHFPVNQCPLTAAAVHGGCFHVELADSAAPPAVLAVLASAGYAGMIGAGAPDLGGTGWFVELYTDAASVLPAGADEAALAAVLRALVALALHPDPA
ncbi:MAG TPA: diguanylate cyclase [Mycobacteriales bacterium]|jgi:diguanylate cyclase (GGDEF)-like protein|nr:diguanylate cyclase [Mycobacteriales bacterium]